MQFYVYEVIIRGYDNDNSKTEALLKWIKAPKQEAVATYCKSLGLSIERITKLFGREVLDIVDGVDVVVNDSGNRVVTAPNCNPSEWKKEAEELLKQLNRKDEMTSFPVLVTDRDEDDRHIHYLVMTPTGMTTAQVRKAITEAYQKAVNERRDEWSYGDVRQFLGDNGFICRDIAEWEEHTDG